MAASMSIKAGVGESGQTRFNRLPIRSGTCLHWRLAQR
jgi:hypothetical protein